MTSDLLGAYAPQDLATTSYALAKFAYRPQPAWLQRVQEVALLKEDDFTEQALAIAAWSVLVLDTGRTCDAILARAARFACRPLPRLLCLPCPCLAPDSKARISQRRTRHC